MGCFLACFGIKKKKKRRNPTKKSLSGEQNHGSYVALDSDISIKLDNKENHFTSEPNQHKEKPKGSSISKIKKKVSFNLNVKAYEPIPHDGDNDIGIYLSEEEEETKWEFNTETKSMTSLHFEEDSITYPANYRYQNCRDSYDDLKLDEHDLDIDDIEDADEEDCDIYSNESNDDIIDQEKSRNLEHLYELQEKELVGFRSKIHAGDQRSQYVSSVLNPVENLSQWKSVKAKSEVPKLKKYQKENLVSDQNCDSLSLKKMRNSNVSSQALGQKIAVDASLSNWLGSNRIMTEL